MSNIIIQPIELAINKDNNGEYYIWASLFDIKASHKEDLNFVTEKLYLKKAFSFSNTGRYAGTTPKDNMHFTFDDGDESISWLYNLLDALNNINEYLHVVNKQANIRFEIIKKDLLDRDISDINNIIPNMSDALQEKLVNAYVNSYQQILNGYRYRLYGDLFGYYNLKKIESSKSKLYVAVKDKIYVRSNRDKTGIL